MDHKNINVKLFVNLFAFCDIRVSFELVSSPETSKGFSAPLSASPPASSPFLWPTPHRDGGKQDVQAERLSCHSPAKSYLCREHSQEWRLTGSFLLKGFSRRIPL
jgi:hypothetical protein